MLKLNNLPEVFKYDLKTLCCRDSVTCTDVDKSFRF